MVRTSGGTIDTIVYIDGMFEYRTDGTNTQSITYLMDDQSRIARIRVGNNFGDTAGNSMYLMEDHLGSITMRATTTGSITDREEYYPFGDSSLRTWTKKRYRYTGKEKDEESGLYYYGARYYTAWTCRFISVDPLSGDYPFYTLYNYAGNKPIGKVDIDGMQEEGAAKGPTSTNNNSEKHFLERPATIPMVGATDAADNNENKTGGMQITSDNLSNVNDFVSMLSDLTGNDYEMDGNRLINNGQRYREGIIGPVNSKSEILSNIIDKAIKMKSAIPLDIQGNSSDPNTGAAFDNWETGKVGLDDLKMAPRELRAAMIGHFLMERIATPGPGGYSNPENRSTQNFGDQQGLGGTHQVGLNAERDILSEMTGLELNMRQENWTSDMRFNPSHATEEYDYGNLKYEFKYTKWWNPITRNTESNVNNMTSVKRIR